MSGLSIPSPMALVAIITLCTPAMNSSLHTFALARRHAPVVVAHGDAALGEEVVELVG